MPHATTSPRASKSEPYREFIEEALRLPVEARAALAGSLLDSLDEKVDADAEEAWSQEIARRIAELETGLVTAVPWSEVRRSILRARREAKRR